MRRSRSRFLALILLLSTWIPGHLTAEPVTVIRGNDVTVLDVEGRDSWEERIVLPAASDDLASEPVQPETAPLALQIVVIHAGEDEAWNTAWRLISPWQRGIETHRIGRTGRSQRVAPRGIPGRGPFQIRIHRTGDVGRLWEIPTLRLGAIRTHRMGLRRPSRIRVHGVRH